MCLSGRCSSCQHSAIDSGIDHHNLYDVTKNQGFTKKDQDYIEKCFYEWFTKDDKERGGCSAQDDYLTGLSKREVLHMLMEAFEEGFLKASAEDWR